jgi:energy-coupling factor transporter ATP-binding protein EcfA2
MSQSPTPDPSWKGLPSWLFFAFLVIAPPTALVTFTRMAAQNTFLTVLIILGYEVVIFVFRFTEKIWQKVEEPLVERIGQWFNLRLQEMASQYYRQYRRYMVAEHKIFDVKGLKTQSPFSLVLEEVFVDLQILPTPAGQSSANPIEPLPSSLQGAHSIWEYLLNPALADSHLVILGAPGFGKTTLLKHLALTLLQPQKYHQYRLWSHSFPILLFLRDHAQTIVDQPFFSLADMVEEHIKLRWQRAIPASWIARYLERGMCLVLLDGLDEVADHSARQAVVAWVGRQLIAYGGNRFVLTSRSYGYLDNPLSGVTVLDVLKFTSDQVEQFVRNWYLANEVKSQGTYDLSVRLYAEQGAKDLLRRIHLAPALLSLAANPLLLTMIATVHRYRSFLPDKRVDLYAEICEVFLGKWREVRGIEQELSPAQKQHVLQPLAYWMMEQGKSEVTREEAVHVIKPVLEQVATQMLPEDFLLLIENTSGLLLENKVGSENKAGLYGFAHSTFREYLAAVYIKEERKEDVLVGKVIDIWWHETIRLYCAQADASAVVQACLAVSPLKVETLVLALECEEEKLKIQPQVKAQLNEALKTNIEGINPERQRLIAETLLTRRLNRMIHLQKKTYIDTSLISCIEYQLFLDEQQAQGHHHQPDQWTAASFPKNAGSSPVLGVSRSDSQAFCDWLTARDREGWHYRLPHAKEWPVEERKQRKELSAEIGYWTDDDARFEWVQGEPPRVFLEQVDLVLARASDFDRVRALDHNRTRIRDRVRIFTFARALDRALDEARASDRDLSSALVQVLNYDLDPAIKLARARAHDSRVFERDLAIASKRVDAFNRARDRALDLYILYHLLQERIAGNFPAYEGILLVKER